MLDKRILHESDTLLTILSLQNLGPNAPVICPALPQPPPPGEGWRIAGLKCRAITFRVSSKCRGNDRVLTIGSLPQEDYLLQRAGQRAKF